MRTLKTICFLFLLSACSESTSSKLDFLVGTWQREGKEQYEVWQTKGEELVGYSYTIRDNQKTITETLTIKKINNHVIFEATVPDQNEGKTVPFILNNEIKAYLSFENIDHDFPKKIQYKRINDNEIEVTVLGDEGEGFSYIQLKQIIE